ncbi:MAG: hypothetical protein ACXW48_16420 [Candidatus Binatia bacterium]
MKSAKFVQAVVFCSATLFAGGLAQAGSIYTPAIFSGGGNQVVCIATNATGAPITVTVRIFGVLGDATDTCTIDPNDPGGCQVFRNNDAGFCRITVAALSNAEVAKRVRGVMFSRKTTSPFTVESVVQAQ